MFRFSTRSIIRNIKQFYIFLYVILLTTIFVQANEITICREDCDYTSIATGVAAANPGDTLLVHSGIYNESVNINKSLVLRGLKNGNDLPIVDAYGRKDSAITFSSDGIVIEGFKVRAASGHLYREWAGIKVMSNNNSIIGIIAEENDNGIVLIGSSNNTLEGNNISKNENGIILKESRDNLIENNNINGNIYGIYLISAANNTLTKNSVIDNDYGILLNSSAGNVLRYNIMNKNTNNFGAEGKNDIDKSNLVDDNPIYYLVGMGVSHTIIINSSSKAGTVYCINCRNVTIKDLILKNNLNGIFLHNTTDSILENNTLYDNNFGISLLDSSKNIINGNIFRHNRVDGLVIKSSKSNNIRKNLISESGHYGLTILYSDYNNITTNNISFNNNGVGLNQSYNNQIIKENNINFNNKTGLLILDSVGNNVSMNNFSYNNKGTWLINSMMNYIIGNNVFSNADGIRLEFSSDNTIGENHIIGNRYGVAFDPIYENFGFNNFEENNKMLSNGKNTTEIVSIRPACPVGGCPPTRPPPGGDKKTTPDNKPNKKATTK